MRSANAGEYDAARQAVRELHGELWATNQSRSVGPDVRQAALAALDSAEELRVWIENRGLPGLMTAAEAQLIVSYVAGRKSRVAIARRRLIPGHSGYLGDVFSDPHPNWTERFVETDEGWSTEIVPITVASSP